MGGTVRRITPVALDAGSWAPFGWLPVADTDPTDGDHRLSYAWDDVHVNVIGHRRDEVPAVDGGLRCEMLYRHVTHTQVLMAIDVPAVVAVAPPGVDLDSPADAEGIVAFRLDPLQPFVLSRGTWHWGPFPVAAESVALFNVQGLRYAEDNERGDLVALGTPLDVVVG